MRTRVLLAVVAAGAIGLAACGGDNSSTSSTAAPAAASATTAAAAAATTTATTAAADSSGGYYAVPASSAPAAAAASTTLTLIDSSHGKIIADAQGHTLYIFTKDSPGTSACADQCAKAWPPAPATGTPTAASDITATALSTITRADGTTQVAINGQPLYTYAGDAAPGDTQGQGSNQIWWVVGADGTAIKT
jgi:predicted lipoprotein with Yx(FWY)xxD motif